MGGKARNQALASARMSAKWTPERRAARSAQLSELNRQGQGQKAVKARWEVYWSTHDEEVVAKRRALKGKFYCRTQYLREKISKGNLRVGDTVGPWIIDELWCASYGEDHASVRCHNCGYEDLFKVRDLEHQIYGFCIQFGKTSTISRHGVGPIGFRPWAHVASHYMSLHRGPKDPVETFPARKPKGPKNYAREQVIHLGDLLSRPYESRRSRYKERKSRGSTSEIETSGPEESG